MSVAKSVAVRPVVRLSLLATAVLSACAQMPVSPAGAAGSAPAASPPGAAGVRPVVSPGAASAPASPASAASAAASAPVSAPAPGQPPPFAAVIRDAKRLEGAFAIWRKDDRVWIELSDKDFGSPLFLSPKLKTGIGEAGFFGGTMASRWGQVGRPQLVEFRRVFNQVQLLARNTEYVARAGTPEARAVAAAYSPSLIASAQVASQPHPERKTVLVEVNSLLMGDWPGLSTLLQRAYRQGYGYDARNSTLLGARAKSDEVVFEIRNHYATAALATAQPGASAGLAPATPTTLPDPRSLFIEIHYSLSRLPVVPMPIRRADPRVGYFVSTASDFGDDLQRTPRQRFINRWRLEKKEPAAALSEPVKPITYWIDPSVPERYRASMTAGILEWNKAFEKIGFKNAIVVKVQTDKDAFDTLDTGVASVRWMTNAQPSFGAVGPSHVDPRSGEILDADISFESLSSRNLRAARTQILTAAPSSSSALSQALPWVATPWLELLQARDALREQAVRAGEPGGHTAADACEHADLAAEQLGYALDVLALQGQLEPGAPEVEAFVQAYLKDVTMHEVGHSLGLRHNFRASRAYTQAQLEDPAFGAGHALTGSVMEYAAVNLPRPGRPMTPPFQTTLGPYDYWAIEYGYKPLASAEEKAALGALAARNAEPELAFGTDEDSYLGIDPESLQFDLGDDPVVFAAKRIDIVRDLLQRAETRPLPLDEDFAVLRRVVSYAFRDLARNAGILARQIGGVRTLRDFPNTGRDPLTPVPAERQRAALDLLSDSVFGARGLQVSATLQRRLAPDFLERGDAALEGGAQVATDYAPQQALFELQRGLLAQLMSDGVAQRLLDSEAKTAPERLRADPRREAPAAPSLGLVELYRRLDQAIWSELGSRTGEIPAARRDLQREHVERLASLVLRPAQLSRGDARSLVRQHALQLQTRLDAAARRGGGSEATRSHLRAVAETLREALAAKVQRPV